MKKKELLIWLIGIINFLFQLNTIFGQVSTAGQELNVTWPSPNAASLFKYLEYPVDYATGVPNISIPIYEIKSGELNVPISISYHASGRKVYDETGSIGLGWCLNAGGMISRSVFGWPDDDDYKAKFPWPWRSMNNDLDVFDDYFFLTGADKREEFTSNPYIDYHLYEVQPDIFSYSFNSISGKFVFKDSANIKIPVLLPKTSLKIEKQSNTANYHNFYEYINIIDDKGILYRFGKSLINGTSYYEKGGSSYSYISSWLLTEIVSTDKTDTISFKYTSFGKQRKTVIYEGINRSYFQLGSDPPPMNEYIHDTRENIEQMTIQILTEVKFNQGKITITLAKDDKNNTIDQIDKIHVYNKNNELIKTFTFYRSPLDISMFYSSPGVKNYKLDSVIFKDSQQKGIEKYSLYYYPSESYIFAVAQDLWGYHNSAGVDNDLVPFSSNPQTGEFEPNPYSDRKASPEAMKCGILRKIIYPTGGSTEFIYEGNKYKDIDNQEKKCGGLRLYQKKTTDNNGNAKLITYEYGNNGCDYGLIMANPNIDKFVYGITYIEVGPPANANEWYSESRVSCNVLPQYGYFMQTPIFYPEVTEYYGTRTANTGKIVYKYNFPNGSTIGRFGPNVRYNYWDRNTLINAITFKSRQVSSQIYYDTVKLVTNYYRKTQYDDEQIPGLLINRKYIITPNSIFPSDSPDSCLNYNGFWGPCYYYRQGDSYEKAFAYNHQYDWVGKIYSFFDYGISVGKTELIATNETDYTANGKIEQKKSYEYHPKYHLLISKWEYNSNQVLETHYKYPFDNPVSTLDRTMIDHNMINYNVEANIYRNANLSEGHKTIYRDWGNNIIAPDSVYIRYGNNPYVLRLKYHLYDNKGNMLQYQKSEDKNISFLWGYNGCYPVAQIENASINEVKTLFGGSLPNIGNAGLTAEHNNTLRSGLSKALITTYTYKPLIGMTSQTDPNGITTNYVYDDFGRLKLIKDNDLRILRTYEYKEINPSYFNAERSQTFTKNDCGPDFIGTSKTYKVPAGIYSSGISQADADAQADADIEENGQNYANSFGSCFIYKNDQKSQLFTKNNCATGYLGSEVNYIIPYGTYTSLISQDDANQKALNDIAANGQAYANTNGTCRPDITYYNVAKSGTFTKSNCDFGYDGGQVTYTVAANTYSSNISQEDADNMAINDVNNNGQGYANSHGTCTKLPTYAITINGLLSYDTHVIFTKGSQTGNYVIPGGSGTIYVPKGTYNVMVIRLLGCSGETHTFTIVGGISQSGVCTGYFPNMSIQSSSYTININ